MKYSVSSYSFSQYINAGKMTQLDTIAKAKEMGFDAIEFSELQPPDGVSLRDYAMQLAAECKRVGIPVSNLAIGADFIGGSNGNFEAEVERVKGMVDIAAILGAPFMRHDVAYSLGEYRSFDMALPRIAEGCRLVTEYAQTKGIVTSSENHGFISQDSYRVEKLFNAVNHPNFGLLTDIGNFTCADEVPSSAVNRVANLAVYVHAKDFIIHPASGPNPGKGFFRSRGGNYLRGTIIGHGNVNVMHCLTILKKAGYNGYISIEFEGMEDCIFGIETGLENLKTYINSINF